ncbi:MAG: ATP F0F1 synthase subunit B, partial [Pseudomonadota bacterium]
AEQLKQQTDEAIASYEQALAEARARAHGLAQETRESLSQEVEAEKAEVEKQIAGKMAEAEKAIADATSSAIGNLSEVATDVAQAVVTELIGGKLTKAETSKAVSKALAN